MTAPGNVVLSPFPPMKATLATALPVGPGWSYEVKWDGYRALLLKDGNRTRLISRNLKDLTADYPHIAAAAPRVTTKPVMLDGEIVALDEDGRPAFQALHHRSLKPAAMVFYAFDLLHLGATDYRSKPLRERRRALARLKFAAPILLSVPLPGTPDEICEALNMRSAGCVFVGVVFAAILFFGGHVTVLTSQKPASAADAPAATSAQVAWLIFVDDLHLDFVSTGRLRDVLRSAASTLGEGAALVGVQSFGPSRVSLPPSTDLVGRDAAILRIVGHGLRPGDFLVGNAPGATRELRYRAHTSLSAL